MYTFIEVRILLGERLQDIRNDCFANLSLTVQALESLRSWIRVVHDGPNYWMWERKWLMDPREVRICLQTHRHCQLSDEELYQRMKMIAV